MINGKIIDLSKESETSISAMEEGMLLAEESVTNASSAGEVLQQIVESSNKVMDMVQRIATATEQQSSTAEDVSRNMEDIAEIIKDNFTMSEELNQATFELAHSANEINTQAMRFKTKENDCSFNEEIQNNAQANSNNMPIESA